MEEFMNADRRVRRGTEQGRDNNYCYSEDEHETADALILLSVSGGGFCVSSTSSSGSTISDIKSGDSTETSTVTPIPRHHKNSLVLRIRVAFKPAKQITYKCDICDREFGSPQALGGHKTSHRRKLIIPDLNEPLRVYECSICGDVYDSGRALGGHKRKHRT